MDTRSLHNLVIPGWMVFELHLNYSELRIYALIYGYSQGAQGEFYGSLQYLADWCGLANKSNVHRVLQNLIKKGLIRKYTDTALTNNGRTKRHSHYQAIVPENMWKTEVSQY